MSRPELQASSRRGGVDEFVTHIPGDPMRVSSILLVGLICSTAQAQTKRPLNLLLILDDQHNPRMLGVETNGVGGVPVSLTPNLDSLGVGDTEGLAMACAGPES